MKKAVLCFVICCLSLMVQSQSRNQFAIDATVVSHKKQGGFYDSYYYSPDWIYFSGLTFNYFTKSNNKYFVGIHRLDYQNEIELNIREQTALKGMELTIGVHRIQPIFSFLDLEYGVELIGESSKLKGSMRTDYSPTVNIDSDKYYLGFGRVLMINIRLTQHVSIYASARTRVGKTFLISNLENHDLDEFAKYQSFCSDLFDPFSSSGLRIRF